MAPDLPGFGQSLRRECHWSVGDFAANLIECLQGWGLDRCALVGGHLASLIAMEVAQRAPQRLAWLGLDGTPVWDEALRSDILHKATPAPMVLREDGEHLKALWQHLPAAATGGASAAGASGVTVGSVAISRSAARRRSISSRPSSADTARRQAVRPISSLPA